MNFGSTEADREAERKRERMKMMTSLTKIGHEFSCSVKCFMVLIKWLKLLSLNISPIYSLSAPYTHHIHSIHWAFWSTDAALLNHKNGRMWKIIWIILRIDAYKEAFMRLSLMSRNTCACACACVYPYDMTIEKKAWNTCFRKNNSLL